MRMQCLCGLPTPPPRHPRFAAIVSPARPSRDVCHLLRPSCAVESAPELLILRSNLQNSPSGIGTFWERVQVGQPEGTAAYRIGKTGAELRDLGYSKLTIAVGSRSKQFNDLDLGGLDSTKTGCDDLDDIGMPLGNGYWWHNGQANCKGSSHFGLAKESSAAEESSGYVGSGCPPPNNPPSCGGTFRWGHFHRCTVDTGVYVWGEECIGESCCGKRPPTAPRFRQRRRQLFVKIVKPA